MVLLLLTTNLEKILGLKPEKPLIPLKTNTYFQDMFVLPFSLLKRNKTAEMSDDNLSSL